MVTSQGGRCRKILAPGRGQSQRCPTATLVEGVKGSREGYGLCAYVQGAKLKKIIDISEIQTAYSTGLDGFRRLTLQTWSTGCVMHERLPTAIRLSPITRPVVSYILVSFACQQPTTNFRAHFAPAGDFSRRFFSLFSV